MSKNLSSKPLQLKTRNLPKSTRISSALTQLFEELEYVSPPVASELLAPVDAPASMPAPARVQPSLPGDPPAPVEPLCLVPPALVETPLPSPDTPPTLDVQFTAEALPALDSPIAAVDALAEVAPIASDAPIIAVDPTTLACPFLGIQSDVETLSSTAAIPNCCHRLARPRAVLADIQASTCLAPGEAYRSCSRYRQAPVASTVLPDPDLFLAETPATPPIESIVPFQVLFLIAAVTAFLFFLYGSIPALFAP